MGARDRKNPGVLTARDQQIAALVASGMTYVETGKQLKLSENTIRRAMARPEMRAEVDAIRGRVIEAGLGKLCDGFTAAVVELSRLVREGTSADSIKLGAVRLTIESVLKVREQVTLARDVEELRRMIHEPAGGSEPPEEARGRAAGEPVGAGDAGRFESGPGADLLISERGGNELGPVAGGLTPSGLDALLAPGEPTGWQE
jgi:hypothetical protein